MKKMLLRFVMFTALLCLAVAGVYAQVSISATGVAVTENFNTLASSGTSSSVPAGWAFTETGSNANSTYTAGTGSGNSGDTYSFGTTASDRAFGTLLSGSLTSRVGAGFVNNTGVTITSLDISYTGEQWRLGTSGRGADKLEFAYSTNATSLTSGTYTTFSSLDFSSPVTSGTVGPLDGNASANRTAKSATISGLTLAPGGVIWLRWLDIDATSADDGLSIDDFSVTATGGSAPVAPANDLCANATTLSVPSATIAGTLASATYTSPFTQQDVWYSFTATCYGSYTILLNGFTGDVDLELYQGSCPSSASFLYHSNSTTGTEIISELLTTGTYYVRVLAYNTAAQTSAFNIAVSSICPCATPAAGVSNLSFTGSTSASISASFSAAVPEPTGGYLVIRSTSSSLSSYPADGSSYLTNASIGGGVVAANINANGSASYSFNETVLSSNTQYYFFVIPYNYQSGTCLHAYGSGLTVSGSSYTCPVVATPSAGTATATSALVTWSAPSGNGTVTSYDLQWRTAPSGTYTLVANVTSPYVLSGLSANTAYDVEVRAANSVCTGDFSSTLTLTTGQLSAPTANPATACAADFTASWSSEAGASGYQLDVSTYPNFVNASLASDLFFSEYVEGSGSNKYLEIYNGTGAAVNLSDYRLRLFANGASSATNDVLLSGTLANGATIVYENSAATIYGGATTSSTSVNYNGNDAVALYKVSTGSYVDIFGNIGEDPGSAWTAGGNTTVNKTLVRKSTVFGGVTTDPASGFPTLATEWEMYDQDDVSNLGAHLYGAPSFVSGYNSLAVAGTSQAVTGLAPNTTYYYRVRSNSANSNSDNSNVIAVTTTTPLAFDYCPGNITQGTDVGTCTGVINYAVTVSGSPAPTIAYSIPSGTAFALGTTTVTVTASNACETITCSFEVTVEDTEAPAITCPLNQTVYLDANCEWTVPDYVRTVTVSDNCMGPVDLISFTPNQSASLNLTITQSPVAGSIISGPAGLPVVLTVTDGSGNAADCHFTVEVLDATSPTALCKDITLNLDTFGFTAVSAADVDNGSSDACGSVSLSLSASGFTCADAGVHSVTLTVTDNSNNSSTCTAQVTVADTIAPTAICQSITINLNTAGTAVVSAGALDLESYDACGVVSYALSKETFNCANVGNNSVVLTLTDASGNSSTCSPTVTVHDNTAPDAVCQDATLLLDNTGSLTVLSSDIDNGSYDACGIASMSVSPSAFDCSNVGDNPVVLTVTDGNGNLSVCSAIVTVEDNTAPAAVCKNTGLQLDAFGHAVLAASALNNNSSDACGVNSLEVSKEEFTCENVGPNTVTLIVTDVNGNTSTCTATVLVQDKIVATAICQNVEVELGANGEGYITAEQLDGGSYDNCGIDSVGSDITVFTCANLGANYVTLTVTDANGNNSQCVSTVTVVDATAPEVSCKNTDVTLSASGSITITAADVDNGTSDNCSVQSLTVSPSTFDCGNIGANVVTLTATDVNGNESSCVSSVQVKGSIPTCSISAIPTNNTYTGGVPTNIYLGYGPQTVTLQSTMIGGAPQSYAWTGAGTSYLSCTNCASPVFAPTATGIYNFTLTVTNNYGCTSSCTITICVLDVRSANGKVYLSHYPGGSLPCANTSSCSTVSISTSAVAAHLAHTCDHLGSCYGSGPQICSGPVYAKTDESEDQIVDLGTNEGSFAVKAFPNPFSNAFALKVISQTDAALNIKVYDVLGQLISESKGISVLSEIQIGAGLSKGVYLIHVTQEENEKVIRVVKSE